MDRERSHTTQRGGGAGEDDSPRIQGAESKVAPVGLRPIVVIVHPRERRAKCSVAPLRGDPRLEFWNFPRRPADLSGCVRLGMGAPLLGTADLGCGLVVLDGTWRWTASMEHLVAEVPVRSLPPTVTAYPRRSKIFSTSDDRGDPSEGLATIEAIYVACWQLGRSTTGLLDHYAYGDEFLRRNPWLGDAVEHSGKS